MRSSIALVAPLSLAALLWAGAAPADPSEVVAASAQRAPDGNWTFSVTLAHHDTGWDHYANAWEILAPDGTSLGVRELLHPHETEQPFTRSLSGVAVPDGLTSVMIRARCNMDGWAPARFTLKLGQ